MKENDIINCRERIQDDLVSLLDGLDDEVLDDVCEIVVERINDLLEIFNANK